MCNNRSDIQYQDCSDTEVTRITKAAGVVATATLFGRITGYVRDMVFASFFGAGMLSDVFIAAFRVPNLLRRLLGEGSLSLTFVSVFTHYISCGKNDSAYRLAVSALQVLFICLVFISLVGIILTPTILPFMTPGFTEIPRKMELTILLTRIMFPYVIFVGMLALCTGILNVLGHFAAPAFAPVLLNLSMIVSLLITSFSSTEEFLVIGLSIGVLTGGLLQLILQLFVLVKKGIRFWGKLLLWHSGFKKITRIMLPTVFGSAVYQMNIVIGTVLASFLVDGSVACLYYADRIVQFPLGIFAYSLSVAVLPSLSRQVSTGNYDDIGETFAHTINFLFFLTVPAMAGLIILRQPIVEVLFCRGAFDSNAVLLTSDALFYYALGLWAFSAVRVVVSVFFAFCDTVTPVRAAIFSLGVNIYLSIILMKYLGHCGLALATSVASMINLGMLVYSLTGKIGIFPWKIILNSVFKTLICTIFMTICVVNLRNFFMFGCSLGEMSLALSLFLCIFFGVLIFMAVAYIVGLPQPNQIMALLIKYRKS